MNKPTYTITLWKAENQEYLKKDVFFETKLESTAYVCGWYDALREMMDLVGYSVREIKTK